MSSRKNWPLAMSVGLHVVMSAEELEKLHSAGISQVELAVGDMRPFFENDYFEKSVEISEFAKAHGVTISSVHLPFAPFSMIDLTDPRNDLFTIKVQTMIMEAAAKAGIKIAVLHPSGEPYKDDERQERLEMACSVVSALAENAKKLGMQLALENLPRTCLCRTHDEMLYFLDRIPDLRVCFDMNHNLCENNIDYIKAVGDKIITLHVSDYDFVDERHWLPGSGINDWQKIIEALESVGYDGRFLYEVKLSGVTCEDIAENYRMLLG